MNLSKREFIAIQAMNAILSNPSESEVSTHFILEKLGLPIDTKYYFEKHYTKYVSQISVKYADALLEELKLTEK